MARSKRYQENIKKIDKAKTYPINEAITIVKESSKTKFDESIEAHFRLGIDISKGEEQVRGTVILPHGTGQTKKIAAFVTPDKEKEAKDAGAQLVGGEELIKEIKQTGKIEFDVAIALPDMMKNLAPIAKILGPRGLMPSPKNETITTDLAKTIGELKKGKIPFKNDDTANLHVIIGKVSFEEKQLTDNFEALVEALKKSKPSSSKGPFLKSASICSSMGPGIKVIIA